MKCSHCGFPLSPTNTNMPCPRCHNSNSRNSALGTQPQPQRQNDNQVWTTGSYQYQLPFPTPEQAASSQPDQLWQYASTPTPTPSSTPTPTPSSTPSPAPIQTRTLQHQNRAHYGTLNHTQGTIYAPPSAPARPQRSQTRQASNFGFILAGLCIGAGGLILVLVYFMASGLAPSGSVSSSTTTVAKTKKTPATSLVASSPTLVSSPTATAFPAQQYIDNAQMASLVNINTAQPLQTTTTFKVNQKIYVTFNIHPAGKNGAVCLYWYLNNKNVTQFPFSVSASAKAGYSYAVYGGTGNAFVAIYWASTTTCSDKILAQHVNFTVTS